MYNQKQNGGMIFKEIVPFMVLSQLLHECMRSKSHAIEENRNLFCKCSPEKSARTKECTI